MNRFIAHYINQMDEEGRNVFQGTLLLGYSPRQALFNAFGMFQSGTEIDTLPAHWVKNMCVFEDKITEQIFWETSQEDIENTFYERV